MLLPGRFRLFPCTCQMLCNSKRAPYAQTMGSTTRFCCTPLPCVTVRSWELPAPFEAPGGLGGVGMGAGDHAVAGGAALLLRRHLPLPLGQHPCKDSSALSVGQYVRVQP